MTGGDAVGIALAGFSGIGNQDHQTHMYLPAIEGYPGFKVVAVCPSGTTDEKHALLAAQRLGVPCLRDLGEVLRAPGVEAVSVAFPPRVRGNAVADSLRAGKHVLADKPLAPALPEVEEVVGLASRNRLVLLPAHHQRWNPAVRSAGTALSGGQVGLPWNVQADFLVAGGTHAPDGELLNLAIYPVDIIGFLLSLTAVRVYAKAGSYWHDGTDFVALLVEYGSGVTATITVGRMGEISGVAPGGLARHRYRISGSHGVLSVDGNKPGLSIRASASGGSAWAGGSTVDGLVTEFHHAIADGRPASVRPDEVLGAYRVLMAAAVSLQMGRPVAVPDTDGASGRYE